MSVTIDTHASGQICSVSFGTDGVVSYNYDGGSHGGEAIALDSNEDVLITGFEGSSSSNMNTCKYDAIHGGICQIKWDDTLSRFIIQTELKCDYAGLTQFTEMELEIIPEEVLAPELPGMLIKHTKRQYLRWKPLYLKHKITGIIRKGENELTIEDIGYSDYLDSTLNPLYPRR